MKRFKNLNKIQLIFNIPHGPNRFLPTFAYNPCKIGQVLNFSRRLLCENRICRQGGKITFKISKEIFENNLINSKSKDCKRKHFFQPIYNIVKICKFPFFNCTYIKLPKPPSFDQSIFCLNTLNLNEVNIPADQERKTGLLSILFLSQLMLQNNLIGSFR